MNKSSFHIRYVDDETKAWLKAYAQENGMLLAGALRKIMETMRAENPASSLSATSRPQQHETVEKTAGSHLSE